MTETGVQWPGWPLENKENHAMQKVQELVKQFDQITDQCLEFSQSARDVGPLRRGGVRRTFDVDDRSRFAKHHRRSLNGGSTFGNSEPSADSALDRVTRLSADLLNAERDLEQRADMSDESAIRLLYNRITHHFSDLERSSQALRTASALGLGATPLIADKKMAQCQNDLDDKLIALQFKRRDLARLLDAIREWDRDRRPLCEWLHRTVPLVHQLNQADDRQLLDQLVGQYNAHYEEWLCLQQKAERMFDDFQEHDQRNLKLQWNQMVQMWDKITEIIVAAKHRTNSPDLKTKQALSQSEIWFRRQLSKLEHWNQVGFTAPEANRIEEISEKAAKLIAPFRQCAEKIAETAQGRQGLHQLEDMFERINRLVAQLREQVPVERVESKCSSSPTSSHTSSQTFSTRSTTICSSYRPQSQASANGLVRIQFEPECLRDLLDCLQNYNRIRFSNYRTAIKVWAVQKRLCFDLIDLPHVDFHLRQLRIMDSQHDFHIDEQFQLLKPLFERAHTKFPMSVKDVRDAILRATELFKSLTASNDAKTIKCALIFLSNGSLDEKYNYLFTVYANGTTKATRENMLNLFTDLAKFPRLVGEDSTRFGLKSAASSVQSLFKHARDTARLHSDPKSGADLVDHGTLMDWLHLNPETLTWIRTLHCMVQAELARHAAKCAGCKMYPIVGLRFKCLHCFNVDLCQNCFFARKPVKGHKSSHELQEYYAPTNALDNVRDFTQFVHNKVRKHRAHSKIGYTTVDPAQLPEDAPSRPCSTNPPSEIEIDVAMDDVRIKDHLPPPPTGEPPKVPVNLPLQRGTLRSDAMYQIGTPEQIEGATPDELNNLIKVLQTENEMLKHAYDRVRRQPTRSRLITSPVQQLGQVSEELSQAVACMLNLANEQSQC